MALRHLVLGFISDAGKNKRRRPPGGNGTGTGRRFGFLPVVRDNQLPGPPLGASLEHAVGEDAGTFIAITGDDHVNLLASEAARQMGIPTVILRIKDRSTENCPG